MRFILSFAGLILFYNSYSQYNLNKVDSIVISKNYSSIDVKELSFEIAKDFKSDSNIIRAFFIYVVYNIEYDISLAGRVWYPKSNEEMDSITLSEVNFCLKSKKGICWDYSALFQKLCFYQGINVEFIEGTMRNEVIMPLIRNNNHCWNSLIINGKRKFIDCTFDPPDNYHKIKYDKFYLVDPEDFIYRCLPIDPAKQYLSIPYTYEKFKSLPFASNAFFEHRIKNLSQDFVEIKIRPDAHYLISFKVKNIDKLSSFEIYLNDEQVQTVNKIDTIINLKLNLILKKGDMIKIMAVNTISKGDEGVVGTIAPFLTYVAR